MIVVWELVLGDGQECSHSTAIAKLRRKRHLKEYNNIYNFFTSAHFLMALLCNFVLGETKGVSQLHVIKVLHKLSQDDQERVLVCVIIQTVIGVHLSMLG